MFFFYCSEREENNTTQDLVNNQFIQEAVKGNGGTFSILILLITHQSLKIKLIHFSWKQWKVMEALVLSKYFLERMDHFFYEENDLALSILLSNSAYP